MKAYQVKITVKGSHPPIWRRCIIPAGITFSQLAVLFNEIMGWKGYHLFAFQFHDLGICVEEIDEDYADMDYDLEEATETLIDPYMEQVKWFTYCYDFGDDWEHRIDIESVITDCEYTHPVVLKAKGACPFEDCGGIGGYYDFLEAICDPENAEHEGICGWAEATGYMEDGEYDPAYYDIKGINEMLESCFQVRFVKKADESDANTLYEKLLMRESAGTFDAVQKDLSETRREADLEEWRALYEAAMRLKEIEPWETFWDMDLITLEGEWEDEVYVSILGKGGDCYGISVYEGLDGLNDFMMLTLAERMNISSEYAMFSQNNLTCYWGNRDELTKAQWQTIKDLGYKFRGKNQWLYFMSYRKGYFPYNMDQAEVLRMTGYLRMLADAVEASSRTLTDPTPARIKTHIDTIMKGIFSEGQLDESELTFKDLHKLSESFARILTGLFHQRIAYPDLNKDKKTASDKPEQAKVQAKPEEKTEQRPDVKRTVAYAASSVMPGSSGAAAPNGPEQQGAAPAAPHTPVSPSANPGPPIDLVYPVVPGPPKPVNKGPLSMKPVGKRP